MWSFVIAFWITVAGESVGPSVMAHGTGYTTAALCEAARAVALYHVLTHPAMESHAVTHVSAPPCTQGA